jgi:triacylglycerol esterase/lipase EstA (alpha/beta hydrolase family)
MREGSGQLILTAAVVAFATIALSACVTIPRTELVTAKESSDCVVLLHGLNRSYRAMTKMAARLQEAGFSTANVDYPSQAAKVEGLAEMAVNEGLNKCRETDPDQIHFVTHSIGGILLRYAHNESPIPELGRVVMLAPPNQGSEVVDITRNWPTAEIFSGEAGLQLGTDENSIPAQLGPVDFELGVVAGTGTINPFMSAMLPIPNDGKVSVESTKVEGMDDFLVVRKSHHYIVTSDTVIANTTEFLRSGRFIDSTDVVHLP